MRKLSFKDHFSEASDDYRQYRPDYPSALYDYLATIAPSRHRAWDCATGTGQAAAMLGQHFAQVIASDASASQIQQARPAHNVTYRVMPAEHTDLATASIDLICVAQALHWFKLDSFFEEAKRVLRPGGILAVWCYQLLSIDVEIDNIINQLYGDTLDEFWPAERRMIESGYRHINFPFKRETSPAFNMQASWNLHQLLGYLSTWSASRACIRAGHEDPVAAIAEQLQQHWRNAQQCRPVSWPLSLIICRKNN